LKHSPQFVRLTLVLALLVPLAVAQETRMSRDGGAWSQETTGSLAAVKNLRVKVDSGSVKLRGGTQDGISYQVRAKTRTSSEQEAKRQFEAYRVSAWVKGDTAWIVADWQGKPPRHFSGEFTINVPREMGWVKLETAGGMVDASGITGRVDAETGGGGMRLDDIGGGANAETGGGPIEVGTISGDLGLHTGGGTIEVSRASGKLTAESGGGGIKIQTAGQDANIETGGGTIELRQCNGAAKVSTGGGSLDLGDINGSVEADTSGGSIHVTSAKGHVVAHTGGGGVELYGVPSAHVETSAGGITVKLVNTGSARKDSLLETPSGDIVVYVASDIALTIRASVDLGNGHHIRSEFPDIHVTTEGSPYGPRTIAAEGKLNGGGPVLKVRTGTGDIIFKRSDH
jgi:hypothetical protein